MGRAAIWNDEIDRCYYQNHLHRLRGNATIVEPLFVLYWYWYAFEIGSVYFGRANTSTIPNLSSSRLGELPIPVPSLPEQRNIARVLSTVQRAIELQDEIIAMTAELKKALMQKLFTEGLRGEPLKQTEIGLMPESWAIATLGSLMATEPQNGLYKPKSSYGEGIQILRIDDFSNEGDIVSGSPERLAATENEITTYGLRPNDIVLNRVNSLSHLGKTTLAGELRETLLFESNMMRFSVDGAECLPEYAFLFLNSPICKDQILSLAKRAVAQASVNQGDVEALKVPLPPLDTQAEIRDSGLTLSRKIATCRQKRSLLEDLFRTLLHKLMTAQIRVDDLDLSALDEPKAA